MGVEIGVDVVVAVVAGIVATEIARDKQCFMVICVYH